MDLNILCLFCQCVSQYQHKVVCQYCRQVKNVIYLHLVKNYLSNSYYRVWTRFRQGLSLLWSLPWIQHIVESSI